MNKLQDFKKLEMYLHGGLLGYFKNNSTEYGSEILAFFKQFNKTFLCSANLGQDQITWFASSKVKGQDGQLSELIIFFLCRL